MEETVRFSTLILEPSNDDPVYWFKHTPDERPYVCTIQTNRCLSSNRIHRRDNCRFPKAATHCIKQEPPIAILRSVTLLYVPSPVSSLLDSRAHEKESAKTMFDTFVIVEHKLTSTGGQDSSQKERRPRLLIHTIWHIVVSPVGSPVGNCSYVSGHHRQSGVPCDSFEEICQPENTFRLLCFKARSALDMLDDLFCNANWPLFSFRK